MTKILFVTAEVSHFAATGGLAEVAGSLPKAIMETSKSYKVKVIMPLYRKVKEQFIDDLKFIGDATVELAWRKLYMGLFTLMHDGVEYYFVDNEYYFNRDNIYGEYDDGERFAFFSKSIFKAMELMNYYPDIIHANDWHTALVNIYLDILYKKSGKLTNIKSIFTIHNIEYQGVFNLDFLTDVIGIDSCYTELVEYNGLINLIKGAIVTSDLVTTVSPRYAREITTSAFAYGLENITRSNTGKLVGIINGIDVVSYNPEADKFIYKNYGLESLDEKKENKLALQKELKLDVSPSKPVFAVISRLASHKGIDLIIDVIPGLLDLGAQIVILGTGVNYYEDRLKELERAHPQNMRVMLQYNNALSRKFYSASDFFIMPSKSEPCGLSQMIASRYASIPIVRATGGLYDTIEDFDLDKLTGNGFTFRDYDSHALYERIKDACVMYKENKDLFEKLRKNCFEKDFSWNASAKLYIDTYKKLLKK